MSDIQDRVEKLEYIIGQSDRPMMSDPLGETLWSQVWLLQRKMAATEERISDLEATADAPELPDAQVDILAKFIDRHSERLSALEQHQGRAYGPAPVGHQTTDVKAPRTPTAWTPGANYKETLSSFENPEPPKVTDAEAERAGEVYLHAAEGFAGNIRIALQDFLDRRANVSGPADPSHMPADEKYPRDVAPAFEHDLRDLINRHSMENGSDTPDFMLADYLVQCLENFDVIVKARGIWKGRSP